MLETKYHIPCYRCKCCILTDDYMSRCEFYDISTLLSVSDLYIKVQRNRDITTGCKEFIHNDIDYIVIPYSKIHTSGIIL